MTLEDFFTLTEMKDGFTSLSRVEELVSAMKKEKDTINFPDATRQWSAVASAISATENKECLDLFIKLDGLFFIERWLKDAQNFEKETSDSFVEEAMSALLQAVDRLQIENEKLISSGIFITVENLLSYKSSKVQDTARALFDSWRVKDVDFISAGVEKTVISIDPELNNDKHIKTNAGDQNLKSGEETNHADSKDGCTDTVGSAVNIESAKTEVFPSDTEQRVNEEISEELKTEHVVEDVKCCNKLESVPDESVKIQVSDAIENLPRHDDVVAEETIMKTNDASEDVTSNKFTSGDDIVGLGIGPSNGMDKIAEETNSDKKEAKKKHRKGKSKSKSKRFGNSCEFAKHSKITDVIRQTEGMDFENGIVDALEVARLVAKEVEREVAGYNEQSGNSSSSSSSSSSLSSSSSSSSESISRNSSEKPESPESTKLPEIKSMSEKEPLGDASNRDAKLENNHVQEIESSQVTESNTEKSACGFDLNQEFSSEDPTISNPASIVSASRAIAATEFPTAPLRFEGNLGWKGSASTSAFRPASSTSTGSRQRNEFLDIDLNLTEDGDDKIVNPVSVKSSPKRSEKLIKFDLNLIGEDDEDVPSPASSSCIQPSMKNFDLNDNPSHGSEPFLRDLSSSKQFERYVGPPSDDSVISISGTNVKNTFPIQTPLPNLPFPFPNGSRVSEHYMDSGFFRGGSTIGLGPSVPPFTPQSMYTYNGFAVGPTTPFPSGQVYPYMLDPRGSPFMGQMMGSTSSTAPPSHSQHSFVMNPFRQNVVETNPRYIETGNRDNLFYRPLFIPGQAARPPPLEEQMRENFFRPLNSSSSGTSSGKRKEPENGWELFPTNYKHHKPPHL